MVVCIELLAELSQLPAVPRICLDRGSEVEFFGILSGVSIAFAGKDCRQQK
jgi:hypothetical protein